MHIQGWNGAIGNARWWGRALGFSAFVGGVVGLLGPYGSFYNNVGLRLVDWTTVIVLQTIILGCIVPPTIRVLTASGLARPFALGVGIIASAGPGSVAAAAVSTLLWGQYVSHYRWYDWYLQTLLLVVILTFLWAVIEVALRSSLPAGNQPEAVPADLAGSVVCLQMEDHYVRVHRESGSTLELMPLRDAINRYGRSGGLQVHRSWWVAAGAVKAIERNSRNVRLVLRNGLVVPVARNRIHDLRGRGWLEVAPAAAGEARTG